MYNILPNYIKSTQNMFGSWINCELNFIYYFMIDSVIFDLLIS